MDPVRITKEEVPLKMVDRPISDWALLRENGGRRLIVALSGINGRPGKFSFYHSLAMPGSDLLLLNCPDNGWYFEGIPIGKGQTSLAGTVKFLHEISSNYDETVVIGGSMGGYGALLYGSELPKATVLAMSPEVYAGIKRGYFAKAARVNSLPPGLSAIFSRNPDFAPLIIAGEKRATDLFCLSEISPHHILTVKNGYHTVPAVVHRFLNGISNAVDPLVNGTLVQRLEPIKGMMKFWPDLSCFLYLFELGRVPVERACRIFETIPSNTYVGGFLSLAIAKHLERTKNLEGALHYASLARKVNPHDIETHEVHDRVHFALHGVLPESKYKDFIDPLFSDIEMYEASLKELRELHEHCV